MAVELWWKYFCLHVVLLVLAPSVTQGWGDKVQLVDVQVLTLRQGQMTSGRRSSPVPQMKCVGGSAGCSAFVPKVVQCYNRGSDGSDVQWECKADMDNKYRFGEVAVTCEGYDHPDDPYILKGSCGLEYTVDHVGGGDSGYSSHDSGYASSHNHGNQGYRKHHRKSSGWMSTFIMWGVLAGIAYYIYTTCVANQHPADGTQYASQQSSAPPPAAGFRPEYTQGQSNYPTSSASSSDGSNGYGGFWSGLGAGGLAGYLFGSSRGYGNTGYNRNPYYSQGYGGNSWFGGNGGNTGWFGGNTGNTGSWFGNGHGASSGWSGTSYRSSSPSSSSSTGSRTASGFGGTKRR